MVYYIAPDKWEGFTSLSISINDFTLTTLRIASRDLPFALEMRLILLFSVLLGLVHGQIKTENTVDRESSVFGFVAFPRVFDGLTIDSLETPIQFRAILYLHLAAWNAWCNYHPTAADIFGRTRFKRPAAEHTRENKNTASLFAIFRVYEASPNNFGGRSGIPLYRALIKERGLDPDDNSTDLATPIGIGNRAGADTARLMFMDGWNSESDLTATQQNYKIPFEDYSNYRPRNSPWEIRFPFKWQPVMENNGRGSFFRQEFVTPYAGSAIAFTLSPNEVQRRKVRPPYARGSASLNEALYSDIKKLRRYARKLLRASEKLTEEQMVFAELFDNKAKAFRNKNNPFGVGSIATAIRFFVLGPALDWNLDQEMIYGMGANFAAFDSMVVAWKEKRRVDAIRPTGQTMKLLFGNGKVKVWGGPGLGTVQIKPEEWQPYIRTMPHSEFPSGSSCACAAVVEHALVNTKNRDYFPYNFTVPKGSSKLHPGRIPSRNVDIQISRLSDWSRLCSKSRLWAGVHFEPSIAAGEKLCKGIGRSSQRLMDQLVAGKLDGKWMKWLPAKSERFWDRE